MSEATSTTATGTGAGAKRSKYPPPVFEDGEWKHTVYKRDWAEPLKRVQKFPLMIDDLNVLQHLFVLIFEIMIKYALGQMLHFDGLRIAELNGFDFSKFFVTIIVERIEKGKIKVTFNYIHDKTTVSISIHIEIVEGGLFSLGLVSNKNVDLKTLVQRMGFCHYKPEAIRGWASDCFIDFLEWLDFNRRVVVDETEKNLVISTERVTVILNETEYNARINMTELEDAFVGMHSLLFAD